MDARRAWRGVVWGVAATVAMSALMLLGVATGMSPMPKPIPAAIAGHLTGGGLPRPALMLLAVVLHLGYGAFWGGVLAALTRRVTVGRGLALGAGLWLFMQVAVLPWLGWGAFGARRTPKIAVATLVLHLVYGTVLGWGLGRGDVAVGGASRAGAAPPPAGSS